MRSPLLLAIGLVLASGCSRGPDLMPLEVGRTTTYTITAGLQRYVERVEVVDEIPVLGTTGYELAGPMGKSRIAWKDGVLWAKETANARFSPPIPIAMKQGKERSWAGEIEMLGQKRKATATLTQTDEKIQLGSRKIDTVLSVLKVDLPKDVFELSSWFQPGFGLVRQEQRNSGNLIVRTELLSVS